MISLSRQTLRATFAGVSLVLLAACGSDAPVAPATPALFSTAVAFGASLDDTGNACNLSPAACTPAPYASPRVSNGTLWLELVAQKYGATVTPSRTGGTNYAYSGARTGPITGTTQGVPNMVQQVDTYLASGSTANRTQTLFIVNGATVGNDINDALVQGLTNPQAPAAIIAGAVTNMVNMINKLYTGGARHILIVNSTDIGKTPLVRSAGALASATATALSTQFNAALAAQLPTIRSASTGLNLYLLDLGAVTAEVLAAPSTFGFTNVVAPCLVTAPTTSLCTTPDSYFFWDGFHPTAATGRLISTRAIAALGSVGHAGQRWAGLAQRQSASYIHCMSNPALPTPLVSTSWLAEQLGRPHLRVVDASMYLPTANRNSRAEYDAAHIPGAVFADFAWLSDESAPFPHTLLDAARFAERIGALGIGSDDDVVVYDTSGQNFSAPRLWWMLRTYGHANVALLDGGLMKWRAEGRAVTTDVSPVVPATFGATLHAERVRDITAMTANLSSHAAQVVDARSPGRFQGTEAEPRAGVRGGHIPGSVNVHYATLVNADGTLRSADELRGIVTNAGLDLTRPIVASCGTGVTACAVVLALDVLGVKDTAVFDGSWTEWGSATDTPVALGPA